ncbi:hypothetical protein, partial [Rhodococcus sp. DMU2021]|uniref:hypothetical protein n=1 Tax=Rhodococcus sp. DMU2021 TaxID=2866997 RepID=UPI0035A8E3E4
RSASLDDGYLTFDKPRIHYRTGTSVLYTPGSARMRGNLQASALSMVLLLVVYLTVLNGDFRWVHWWIMWVIMAVGAWMMFRATANHWTAAGASWVQWRSSWVDTYKLTRIRFSADGYSRVLRLKDAHGNEIQSFKISEIQRNPDLWDLVYNGILHSVASGNCDIDAKTRHILKIPYELGPRPTRSERTRGRRRRG